MRAVLVELGRDVRHLFYCSGLKGSTSTALLVSPPSSETCGGSMAAVVGARGDGGGGGSDGRSVDGGDWRHGLRHWSVARGLGPATVPLFAC